MIKISSFCMSSVALCLLFNSWARPGAVTNFKVSQHNTGVKVDDIMVMSVADHKTNLNHGSARLMIKPDLYKRLQDYVTHIRPLIADPDTEDWMFVMPDGTKIKKVQKIARFMESELNITFPSATEVRKIGAAVA